MIVVFSWQRGSRKREKTYMKRISAVIMVAVLVYAVPACGFSLLSYPPFDDPLRTKPPVLDKGVILPGDKAPVPVSCSAPKDFSQPLALGEAVDITLCNNPQILYSWANIKVRAGAVGEARAAYLPTINAGINRTHDRTSYPSSSYPTSDIWRTTGQAAMNWRIFDFGGRAANRRAAEYLLAAALSSHNATLQKALVDVTQAYFDAVSAKAALKAAAESEEIAQTTLATARTREERGAISQSDRLRATTALANTILAHNRAYGDYQKALAVLCRVMAVPAKTTIALPEDMSADAEEMSKDLNGWIDDAERNHPAIVAARAQLEAAQKQVTVARSAGLPTLNFSASHYRNTRPGEAVTVNEARETTWAIGVSIPFFDGFSNTYKIRGAEAQVEQKKAELTDTEKRIALDLIKAYVDASYALKNLSASANLLKAAREAQTVSRRRYDKGAADITEILNTQSAFSEAQHERIRCLAEWHSARLRLLANAGQMGRWATENTASTELKPVRVE
jgi:outer membrane protein